MDKKPRLKPGFAGIVGIYKPVGMTSHDVVNEVRRITGEKRVGHAGTLDPLASGVLIVGVGREFTKRLDQEVVREKEYETVILLGATSTTDDGEGEIKVRNIDENQRPSRELIDETMKYFIGKIWQTPPLFSAVKYKGKEAYKYARKGKKVELSKRMREVKSIDVVEYEWPEIRARIVTGKGVYIRSLARDIGDRLGTGGYMGRLERVRVGKVGVEDCEVIEQINQVFTLVIIERGSRVLLGMKKRGHGEGKWNGWGGKVIKGEGIVRAAKREVVEECGLKIDELQMVGVLDFVMGKSQDRVFVYRAEKVEGEPIETDEMRPGWFEKAAVPYDLIWPDDRIWLPKVFEGEMVRGKFWFDDGNKIINHWMI